MAQLRRYKPLAPARRFYGHLARNAAYGAVLASASLAIGAVGYHATEGLPWLDSMLNAAMTLTGMGPVDRVQTVPGKLFATGYALFSGMVFLTTAALLLGPVARRFLHRFHVDMEEEGPPQDDRDRAGR
jgi:hypothetical protein